jgi:polyphenol oxidase
MSLQPWLSSPGRLLSRHAPPAFFASALARAGKLRHGFFGREGGVSTGIYASLNAGTGSRDDPAAVAENRRRIASAFGADALVGAHQVHSAIAVRVERPFVGPRPQADALVTTVPGLVLSVLTADCAPVLLADAEGGVIGAAHAGWKGALDGVLDAAVEAMLAAGAARGRICAAIGPCIHKGSYEVGPEFEARFLGADGANAAYFHPAQGDRRRFDLPGYCVARLQRLGLNRIEALALDTYSDPAAFFSHRRSVHEKADDYGRNCSAIALSLI